MVEIWYLDQNRVSCERLLVHGQCSSKSLRTSSRKYSPTSLTKFPRWVSVLDISVRVLTLGERPQLMLDLSFEYQLSTGQWHQNPILVSSLTNSSEITLHTSGVSFILYTTTPWCSGVSSVIRPRCAFKTWFPYKNGISPLGFIQI